MELPYVRSYVISKNFLFAKFLGNEGVHKNCAVTVVDVTNEGYEILEEGNTYYKEEVKPW